MDIVVSCFPEKCTDWSVLRHPLGGRRGTTAPRCAVLRGTCRARRAREEQIACTHKKIAGFNQNYILKHFQRSQAAFDQSLNIGSRCCGLSNLSIMT